MTTPYEGIVIPSSPADQLRLSQMIGEVVNSMTRSQAEREHKTQTIKTISEEFNIPKKFISAAAKIMFKQNMEEVEATHEDLSQLVDVISKAKSRSRAMQVQMANAQVTSSAESDVDGDDDEFVGDDDPSVTGGDQDVDDILRSLEESN